MSGSPSEAEVRTQLTNTVAVLERLRAFVDGSTYLGAGGAFDTLIQSLEGTYTPQIESYLGGIRGALASINSPAQAQQMLLPVMFEYGRLLGFGGSYTEPRALTRALYEHFHANTLTVESRNITYDTSFTAGGSNVGNGACSRLTVDARGYALEECTVERKILRCRQDQNSGARENAEQFEILGAAASPDGLQLDSYGSAVQRFIYSHHAGTGNGGSLLRNSGFTDYNASATNKFTGWVASGAGAAAGLDQDTTNYYTVLGGGTTGASVEMTGGGGTITLSQSLSEIAAQRLDPQRPYFFRVMLNKTVGTASGGTVTIRMGAQDASISIASLGSGWQELLITPGTDCWFENFNEDNLAIEIEWSSSSSGTLLVGDAIFAPWDLVDGTYWFLRGNAATHTPWLRDDTLEVTDTGGAWATAKVQRWLVHAGLGYLPSTTGTPTITEPS